MIAAVALGSNLGDRRAHLEFARDQLARLLVGLRVSTFHSTAPVGMQGPQPMFLNAAAVGQTSLPARQLLEALQAIEEQRGRARPHPNAARTLDLDLVLYGDLQINEEGLTVPHPRFRERGFVLKPLAEIAPELRDPATGKTVAELLAALNRASG